MHKAPAHPGYKVVGVRVDALQMPEVIAQLQQWIANGSGGNYVAVTGMHGVSEVLRDPSLRQVINHAGMVVPDGMPLVWLARWHGVPIRRRVTGAELMQMFCEQTGSCYRHFFYGGAPGVAEDLAQKLNRRYGISVAGTYTPPFRPLTDHEEAEIAARVQDAAPDVLWVGLSTPKQERWMYAHRLSLAVPVMLGVGAAFDMHSDRLTRAPVWMQNFGLEWFYRLLAEPRRLSRRYLVMIPTAVWNVLLELMHVVRYE
jgi:N-acetylglucosaminyldiphosphoundecaprenol N-acetyl-beta-D-mannosaminyltransferase